MKNSRKSAKKLFVIVFLIVIAAVLISCSPLQGQPSVTIDTDENVTAGSVTVSVNVSDYDVSGDKGHIIYYLDASVPTYYAHSAISKAGTYAISSETSHTWKGVTPGEHEFSAQLVYNDDTPLPSPVTDSITVNVAAPDGDPQLMIMNPSAGSTVAPGNLYVMLKVSSFIISEEHMGVVNREGEGHLIYYIDEDPPVDQGIPATTDTSVVSTDTTHLWKGLTEGTHTLSVQLVNNDDTPLQTPVAASITIDVSAGG